MSVQAIIAILEKIETMHKSLLEHSYKKTELIKKGDMAELDNMLKTEQSHVAAIETLEKQRQQVVTDYLRAKGIAPSDSPTVSDVIEVAEPEERNHLDAARKRLTLVIDDLRKQNDLNQRLIFQSLQIVNMTLDMLRPRPEQINYTGKNVSGNQTNTKKTYFDSQA